jgi:high-affinity nickel permease
MPIIFEHRLGNSESDRKLRKVFRLHNILWRLYYAIFLAGMGFTIAFFAREVPLLAILIAILTISAIILLFWRPWRKARR